MSADDDAGPGLAEALALWATLAVLCALAWITYARLPAREFYNVTGTGARAGASRCLCCSAGRSASSRSRCSPLQSIGCSPTTHSAVAVGDWSSPALGCRSVSA